MYVVSPMSNCSSPRHRDRFLSLLSAIAKITEPLEPQCLAYAWFQSAEDNDVVPHHWVRGLEVYANLSALTETHRSSDEYKAMRATVVEEALLERPSDLRFLQPVGIGFLTKAEPGGVDSGSDDEYVVIEESMLGVDSSRDELLKELRHIAHVASQEAWRDVLSFWVLERRPEYDDPTIFVFSRFTAKDVWKNFSSDAVVRQLSEAKQAKIESTRTTTWRGTGIGFIKNPEPQG